MVHCINDTLRVLHSAIAFALSVKQAELVAEFYICHHFFRKIFDCVAQTENWLLATLAIFEVTGALLIFVLNFFSALVISDLFLHTKSN